MWIHEKPSAPSVLKLIIETNEDEAISIIEINWKYSISYSGKKMFFAWYNIYFKTTTGPCQTDEFLHNK